LEQVKWFGRNAFDFLIEVENEQAVLRCRPDFPRLGQATERGAIVTARCHRNDADFVSRFFGPACGIDEDPVTGSAHVCLGPYWSAKLGRNELTGFQASARGGLVSTKWSGDRVQLGGNAITIFIGDLLV
jgi:predicted PhzF superfamily epimerase YddE/YHI9